MFLKLQVFVILVIVVINCSFCISGEIIFNLDEHGGKCTTPNNREGTCIKFHKCPSLFSAFQDNSVRTDPLVKAYIGKSFCFRDKNNTPYLCCEKDAEKCTTIENKLGTCIPLDRCDPIARHLSKKQFLDDQKTFYLQFSSCKSNQDDKESRVCCPLIHTNLTDNIIENFYNNPEVPITEQPSSEKPITNKNQPTIDSVDISKMKPAINNRIIVTLPEPGEDAGQCGGNGISDRIIGGKEADIYDYPWMALLQYADGQFRCGGTLINEKYVLTAAHCVVESEKSKEFGPVSMVRLGEWDTSSERDCIVRDEEGYEECTDDPIDNQPEEIIPHPNYTNETLRNDIALIRLSRAVNFTDFIKPVCLPVDDNTNDIPMDQKFTVAGWGRTENAFESPRKLYLDNLPLFDQNRCTELYSKTKQLGPGQICAGGLQEQDSCTGDSGGPLMFAKMVPARGRFYFQTGIISFGTVPCARKDIPAVYTNVAYYMDWILENMKP